MPPTEEFLFGGGSLRPVPPLARRVRRAGALRRVALSWLPLTAALLLAIVLTAPVVAKALGYRTYVVTGGSMSPVAEAGDAIFLEEVTPGDIRVGDLVTYRSLRAGAITTHRVLSHHEVDGQLHFRTRGDANDAPDPELVPASNVIGRVALRLTDVGYLYAFAATGKGRLALIAIPALALIGGELRRLRGGSRRQRGGDVIPLRRRKKRLTAVSVAVLLALGVAGPAAGVLTETLSVGSNTFSTGQVDAPTLDTATADVLLCQITLTWTAPATGFGPDGYNVYRSTTGGGPYSFVKHVSTVTTTTDTGLSLNTTYYYVVQSTLQNWRSVNSNEKSATTSGACI